MMINEEWLDKYYAEVGREIGVASSQLHDTTNWSIGITMAAVTAVGLSAKTYPQTATLAVAVVGFTLVVRFFVRSCLAYANLDKWNNIHRQITKYRLADEGKMDQLRKTILWQIEHYHVRWESPRRIRKVIWSNLKLGYLYLFLILGLLCGIGFARSDWSSPATKMLALACLAVIAYEAIIFPRRTYLRHTKSGLGSEHEEKRAT